MSKYHINKHGEPALCKAVKGNCPYEGNNSHFNTLKEAQLAADEQYKRKYDLIPNLGPEPTKQIIMEKGYLSEEDINKELRNRKQAQMRFRILSKIGDSYKNKFIRVKYDNKEFEGQVIGFHQAGQHESSLIIKNNKGEVKQIKSYRLQELEELK